MPTNKLSGVALASTATGALLIYAAISGKSVLKSIQTIVSGKSPQLLANSSPISGSSADGSSSGSSGTLQTTSGSQTANGTAIYKFLRSAGYSPMQAAGATASMWGESGWNPESVGTGGNGIMGWTPARPGIVTGNVQADMNKQLPMILQFVAENGDQQAVNSMALAGSVNAAATIWGERVERFGISDVHPEGIHAAVAIAKSVDGVDLPAGI